LYSIHFSRSVCQDANRALKQPDTGKTFLEEEGIDNGRLTSIAKANFRND
jgi:hypothetical protein